MSTIAFRNLKLWTALCVSALLLASCSGSSTTSPSQNSEGSKSVDSSSELGGGSTGGNSEEDIQKAVAEFNAQGLDFSPDVLKSSIPDDCTAVDVEAVSVILGIDVVADTEEYPLPFSEGYLSCTFYSKEDPDVALAYAHFGPDLNGDTAELGEGWGAFATRDGAVEIAGLADKAVWSDGSNGTNETNKLLLQLLVDQGGTQSLIQFDNDNPQRELGAEWTVPKAVFALAKINETLA